MTRLIQHPGLLGVCSLLPANSPARVFASCREARRIVCVSAAFPAMAFLGESAELDAEPGPMVSFSSAIRVLCADSTIRTFSMANIPVQSASFAVNAAVLTWLQTYGSLLICAGLPGGISVYNTSGTLINHAEGVLGQIELAIVNTANGYLYAFDGLGRGVVFTVNGTTGSLIMGDVFTVPNGINPQGAVIDGATLVLVTDTRRIALDIGDPDTPEVTSVKLYRAEYPTSVATLTSGEYYVAAHTPPDGFPFAWKQGPTCIKNGLVVGLPGVGALTFLNPAPNEDDDFIDIDQTALPVPPSNVVATAGNATVGVTWNAVSGATSYSVYRGTVTGGETLLASGITARLYNDSTVVNGTQYFYYVTASNATGEGDASDEVNATPNGNAPLNTVAPVASGTALVGQLLSCTDGTWTGTATITFTYQWRRDGVNIALATSNTYTTVSGDLDHAIDCVVTGTNGVGSSPGDSNDIQILAPPVNTVAPVASGGPIVGQTVSCTTGTWTGSPTIAYTYQWRRDGVNIGSATNSTYVLVSGDDGKAIDCMVTATNAAGNASQDSNNISAGTVPANTVAPVASGTGTVGQTLSCTTGTWTGTATISYTYQWRRDGVNIASATSSTYVLVSADATTAVDCMVTGTNSFGSSSQDSNNISVTAATGLTWTTRTSSGDKVWRDICYAPGVGPGVGRFVAISFTSGSTGSIMYSDDNGVTWANANATSVATWTCVTYGNGVFVAVNNSSTAANTVMTSTDGVTWTARTASGAKDWGEICYDGTNFVVIAGPARGTGNQVMTSPDGITWTNRTHPENNQWYSIATDGTILVAVASTGTHRVMTSTDHGVTWSSQTAASASAWVAVTYGNGLFVAVGSSVVMYSSDGISWTLGTIAAQAWNGVAYGNGLFAAVASTGANRAIASTNGSSWTLGTAGTANSWYAVTFGNGTFVAVATTGTGNRVMTATP